MDGQPRLAEMLRLYLALNNTRQERLAEEWGCSASTVTRLVKAGRLPDGPTVARIIAWLFDQKGPQGQA